MVLCSKCFTITLSFSQFHQLTKIFWKSGQTGQKRIQNSVKYLKWINFNKNFYLACLTHCVKSVQIRSFFWSVFSCIRTEYEDSPYSVGIQENTDQKNSVFGHFSRSDRVLNTPLLNRNSNQLDVIS